MRKILVMLLVVGLLIGTFCAIEGLKEIQDGEDVVFDEDYTDALNNLVPCGGEGGGGGGGGGQPG